MKNTAINPALNRYRDEPHPVTSMQRGMQNGMYVRYPEYDEYPEFNFDAASNDPFYQQLFAITRAQGTMFRQPVIGGRVLDYKELFHAVMDMGGFEMMGMKQWQNVASILRFSVTPAITEALRTEYMKVLLSLEPRGEVYSPFLAKNPAIGGVDLQVLDTIIKHKTPEDVTRRTGCERWRHIARNPQVLKIYQQHMQLVDTLQLQLQLNSTLESEITNALNHLLVLSFIKEAEIPWNKTPGLFVALLNLLSVEDLRFEKNTFFAETEDLERINCICLILRNFSFLEKSADYFANHSKLHCLNNVISCFVEHKQTHILSHLIVFFVNLKTANLEKILDLSLYFMENQGEQDAEFMGITLITNMLILHNLQIPKQHLNFLMEKTSSLCLMHSPRLVYNSPQRLACLLLIRRLLKMGLQCDLMQKIVDEIANEMHVNDATPPILMDMIPMLQIDTAKLRKKALECAMNENVPEHIRLNAKRIVNLIK